MSEVFGAYSIAVLLVAIVFVIALVLGFTLRGASYRARLLLNLVGIVILGTAVLEKAGWSVRPWSAGSPAAAFNDTLFRVLALAGIGLLFLSWTIAFNTRQSN
jgi:hypothetical protein